MPVLSRTLLVFFIYQKEAIQPVPKSLVTFHVSYSNISLTVKRGKSLTNFTRCVTLSNKSRNATFSPFYAKTKPLDTALRKVNGNEERKSCQQ